MKALRSFLIWCAVCAGLASCTLASQPAATEPVFPTPTLQNNFAEVTTTPTSGVPTAPAATKTTATNAALSVVVDAGAEVHPISPLIYGVSGAGVAELQSLRPGLNSWGGNPSSRYNWTIGHAWNAGSDWEYRNGNYGATAGSVSDEFISNSAQAGAAVRLAVPTLGWVAKNDDNNTCSFPLPGGGCGNANGASCENPSEKADPNLANVRSDPALVTQWLRYLMVEKGFAVDFVALDNEPELWGYTHYDVHPECTTYAEILEKHLTYSAAVREAAPEAKIAGPVTCCWYFYWNSAAGKVDKAAHLNQDFLPWFLDNVRGADEESGQRSLDVLDLHFYPEGLYNDQADAATAAWRLRSTRSLWDPAYTDESWINEPIMLLPRLKAMIDEHYPGTRLGLSEWNWGADQTMNGALAIADILGIFGREDLYYAAYWMFPPLDSPGALAFRMYTNYDGNGGHFGDTSIEAKSSAVDRIGSYAAIDSATGNLHLMLVNKNPAEVENVRVVLRNYAPEDTARVYLFSEAEPARISASTFAASDDSLLALPAYSITQLVFTPAP